MSQRQSALEVCEQALAEIHRTISLLEQRFVDEEEAEPPGWCPVEAISHLEDAIGMLEPLKDEEPQRRPALSIVR